MKTTVTSYDFHRAFEEHRPDNFSRAALDLLFAYFESYEEATGEEIELDVIAICCDYTECSIDEVAESYRLDIPADVTAEEKAGIVIDYLQDNTAFVGMTDTGSVVYLSF